ncbi:hypothetical protein DFR52_101878 [Hoeflea marina]|uniref:Photosynthetic complex assembly protein n=1 Tax=Hoeflea marina TaxID=274592 RepID=A0A317PV89_9HYPH|nr:hypothetical protein [Hoeflea marina]PWW04186.1 hypothetical protein DFR52_101878 [Hoeflea marina]
MSLGLLVMVVVLGIGLVVAAVHYSGGSLARDDRDPGTAILEFGRAYPTEAIRSVILTETGDAAFLRLADGRTGFLQTMGKHYVARIIDPAYVTAKPLDRGHGMTIMFRESTLKGGDYRFRSAKDAAEVSLWLVESFVVAGREVEERAGQGNG